MINAQISEFLDYFLDEAPPGERAVLINGPWGSGKTHFIKAYLTERDQRRKAREPLSRSHIYVSLYGVRSTADIEDRLFAATHPTLNAWPIMLTASAAARAGNALLGGKLVNSDDGPRLRKSLLNFTDAALVFDDLERAGMPINDVLGFINGYVEHHKVKTILLASEEDIPRLKAYRQRKEKLIGLTLRLSSTPETVLTSFAGALVNPEARIAVEDTLSQLVASFGAAANGNYRIAKDVLHAFDRLVSRVDPRLKQSHEAMADLLPLLMACGLELRTGGLTLPNLPHINSGIQENVEAKRRHMGVNWDTPVLPLEAWAALLMDGRLDVEAMNARIGVHPLVVGATQTPTWRRLWDWRGFGDPVEFEDVCQSLREDIAAHRVVEPGIILQITGIALDLRQSSYALFGDLDPIEEMQAYATDLSARGLLSADREIFEDFNTSAYEGLSYLGRRYQGFDMLWDEMQRLVDKAVDLKALRAAPTLLEAFKEGRWDRLVQAVLDEGGFGETAVLHHLSVSSFADLILVGSRVDGSPLTALSLRYRTHAIDGRPFEVERSWLTALEGMVVARAEQLPPPFRDSALEQLKSRFDKIRTSFGAADPKIEAGAD